jgi:hypothetical protein
VGFRIATKSSISHSLIILLLFTKVETQITYFCDEDDDDDKQKFCHPKHQSYEIILEHLMIILKHMPTHIPSWCQNGYYGDKL